ncbi:MAG: tRNA (adenosine(37)-N6)-threonylcarbamoyltransferase complex dimerization subunit type 1 TsaB [Alphaproteobacteria bacterium]|nr:tRNA (adenosine(37)-N6)-threonylcarbamoyltransferase complex dimerization subunit type 1 TsaB [Alphaproteobacteria bacterium]
MILVINTANNGIDLVLGDHMKHVDAEKQAIALPSAVEIFLNEIGVEMSALTAIGVVIGPGSFTGIRLGIAYAKGLALGLNIPIVPINAFELYLAETPDAFVALESGRGDFFVGAATLEPQTMEIEELETRQMDWPRTVGHKPFNLKLATDIVRKKLESGVNEPVIPMYLRPSYAEEKHGDK